MLLRRRRLLFPGFPCFLGASAQISSWHGDPPHRSIAACCFLPRVKDEMKPTSWCVRSNAMAAIYLARAHERTSARAHVVGVRCAAPIGEPIRSGARSGSDLDRWLELSRGSASTNRSPGRHFGEVAARLAPQIEGVLGTLRPSVRARWIWREL